MKKIYCVWDKEKTELFGKFETREEANAKRKELRKAGTPTEIEEIEQEQKRGKPERFAVVTGDFAYLLSCSDNETVVKEWRWDGDYWKLIYH